MASRSKEAPISLRPYQQECIDKIPERGSYLIQMATGLGKTVVFSRIPRRGRMLILSHRDELVRQPIKYFDCPVGIVQGRSMEHGEDVVSASVQSMVNRLHCFDWGSFDIIVTDEAHHATASSYRKIYDFFKPRLHLGFTATPNRADGIGLEAIFDDIIFERDLLWGIQNGYLSNIRCMRANIGYDLAGIARRMGDFAPGELDRAVNIEGANKAIARIYAEQAVGQTLIFAVSVAHAKAIAKGIPGAVAVTGGEDRVQVVKDFAEGRLKCMVNCMVFTEGTDLPGVETVIIARPTENLSLYTQMVGRGTRLAPGKKELTLIDCVGASDLNLCTAPSLLGLDIRMMPKVARDRIEGHLFDLPEVITRAADTPECWKINLQSVALWAKSKKYNLHNVAWMRMPDGGMTLAKPPFRVDAPDSLGRIWWNGKRIPAQRVFDEVFKNLRENYADIEPLWSTAQVYRWGSAKATEAQLRKIQQIDRLGRVKDVDRLTRLEACQILTRLCMRRPA